MVNKICNNNVGNPWRKELLEMNLKSVCTKMAIVINMFMLYRDLQHFTTSRQTTAILGHIQRSA